MRHDGIHGTEGEAIWWEHAVLQHWIFFKSGNSIEEHHFNDNHPVRCMPAMDDGALRLQLGGLSSRAGAQALRDWSSGTGAQGPDASILPQSQL